MGEYEIVIDKRNGKLEVEGKQFAGRNCLSFLEKLRLGEVVRERCKSSDVHLVNNFCASHTMFSEDM